MHHLNERVRALQQQVEQRKLRGQAEEDMARQVAYRVFAPPNVGWWSTTATTATTTATTNSNNNNNNNDDDDDNNNKPPPPPPPPPKPPPSPPPPPPLPPPPPSRPPRYHYSPSREIEDLRRNLASAKAREEFAKTTIAVEIEAVNQKMAQMQHQLQVTSFCRFRERCRVLA
jgi:hypothetical protein